MVAKTRAWEEDRGISFAYDGVPLLAMLDEYATLRLDREEEKRRMRVNILVGLIVPNFFSFNLTRVILLSSNIKLIHKVETYIHENLQRKSSYQTF